jgi:hypothetical protein
LLLSSLPAPVEVSKRRFSVIHICRKQAAITAFLRGLRRALNWHNLTLSDCRLKKNVMRPAFLH